MPQSTDQQTLRARREQVLQQHIDGENSKDLDKMIASFHHPHYTVMPLGAVSDGEASRPRFDRRSRYIIRLTSTSNPPPLTTPTRP